MKLKKIAIIESLFEVKKIIFDNPWFFPLPILSDLFLFFFVFFFLGGYSEILYIWGLVFIIFIITQSVSFWLCVREAYYKETDYITYFWKFALITIGFVISFGIIYFLIYLIMKSPIGMLYFDVLTQSAIIMDSFFILLYLAFYFMLISYSIISKEKIWNIIKKTFEIGVKKILKMIPAIIVIIIMYVLVDLILRIMIHELVWMITGIIIFFSVLTISRLYLIITIKKIKLG